MIFLLVAYIISVGLISYIASDGAQKQFSVEEALLIAIWPLLILGTPFFFLYLYLVERSSR